MADGRFRVRGDARTLVQYLAGFQRHILNLAVSFNMCFGSPYLHFISPPIKCQLCMYSYRYPNNETLDSVVEGFISGSDQLQPPCHPV